MTELVTLEHAGAVLRLTFNRPEKKNALTQAMYAALADALAAADEDNRVRVIYLTGAGDAFTAGNDLTDFQSGGDSAPATEQPVTRFLRTLATMKKPVVAAVNGLAVGVGVTMLLHCDLVYAGSSASFQTPFVNLGLVPEAGSSLLLPRQIGLAKAAEMLLLGEKVRAPEAAEMGLVTAVVADETLQSVALSKAEALAAKAPSAVRLTKELMRGARDEVLAQMKTESAYFAAQLKSAEFKEAVSAFFERRVPDFSACA